MTMLRQLLHRDQRGTSSVEFAMVAVVLFIIMFGTIDFGRAMWEWNSAGKATQAAVRIAVVTDVIATGLQDFDGLAAAGGNGLCVPLAAIAPNPVICDSSNCNGYTPRDGAAYDLIKDVVRRYYPQVDAPGVEMEVLYEHIDQGGNGCGLGFAGNPFGSDIVPIVTVRIVGGVFNLVTPGLANFVSIPMPDFASTLPGEDGQTITP